MHTRRTPALPSLSLVLPHPPLPRRSSKMTPQERARSPRTPRQSGGPPPSAFFNRFDSTGPRTSTDSWNSIKSGSVDDEIEWEWLSEQTAALTKALDALPSHLLTPFNGVPPSNLLDKVARSMINGKDPLPWPHSIPATRAKIIEIARARALEDAIPEEDSADSTGEDTVNTATNGRKRPYRQSSMDFLLSDKLKDGGRIDRLSSRLQKIDRVIPNPAYHPYSRPGSRSPSPPSSSCRPSGFGDADPMTPAADPKQRNSASSLALSYTRQPRLRRSSTIISSLPSIQSGIASSPAPMTVPHARIAQGMKRSESFSSPGMHGLGHSLKRAPSFGTSSIRSHASSKMAIDDDQKENTPQRDVRKDKFGDKLDLYPSSDEEEKIRSQRAKKPKTRASTTTSTGETAKSTSTSKKSTRASSSSGVKSAATTPSSSLRSKRSSKSRASAASIFGGELPNPQPDPPLPASIPFPIPAPDASVEVPGLVPLKTLRRVKTTSIPSRRLSFSNSLAPSPEVIEGAGDALGSAFELR